MTQYRNPLYPGYGPEYFETLADPIEHRGYLVYCREPLVWDVVKDGICILQAAGPNGAKLAIDELIDAS
ncbi:hypothetical protein C3Y94_025910 [Rhizobium ruizarguesonis]|uniref:hypothetical protein n=1 Tax=Rhizobium ruizarguesonis TaxID=2081791 RepID=UPI00163B4D7D|nr:hypothetical protein [Rhizobium ruizarguesonis]MBC2806590.1 hypothetical protein [Rhizobium ruizarguesonis]